MSIARTQTGDTDVVSTTGRIDASNATEFEDAVRASIDAGTLRLVFDCAGLRYASSAGLRVFLIAAKYLNPVGGRIAVVALDDEVRAIFDIAGLLPLFEFYPDRAAALAALRSPR